MALDQFGSAVRDIRITEGILLYDMAKRFGLSSSDLSGIECGRLPIPDWFVQKLVDTYPSAKAFLPALQIGLENRASIKDEPNNKIWIVSYYDRDQDPVVTPFANQTSATKCYQFFRGKHDHVCIDECLIYTNFTNTERRVGQCEL